MGESKPSGALERIAEAVTQRSEADPTLTRSERAELLMRAGAELIPGGIGAAIGQLYWGSRDQRWQKKIDETVAFLEARIHATAEEVAALRDYYSSDEFAVLFEGVWLRIRQAAQRRQLEALRGALLSILVKRPDFDQPKKESFVNAFDRLGDTHIHVLQLFRERVTAGNPGWFLPTYEVFGILGATAESDQQYVYSAIDTLANLRFIEHGNIPRVGGFDSAIDFPNQRFRATELGQDFLRFIQSDHAVPDRAKPSTVSP